MAVENEATEQEIFPARTFDPEAGMDSEGKKANSNQGWADTMARILENQLPGDKPPVLLKYKKVEKRKAKMKEEKVTKKLRSQERHAMLEKGRVIPDRSTMDLEKKLQRIATRGVVKLFNAVSKHQKETENQLKSAPTEAKKSKVMESMSKSAFLDMLKSSSDKRRTPENLKQQEMKEKQTRTDISSSWNILRDDFMMDAKMKDWNEEESRHNRANKKLTSIADHELANGAAIFDESDDSDNAIDEEDYEKEVSDEG